MARADALGTRLTAEAYAAPGGRLWLARQAARKLSIGSATLDSRDARVPPPIDLDAWVDLLVGAPREPGR